MVVGGSAGILSVDMLTPTVNWILAGCPAASRPDSTAVLLSTILAAIAMTAWHVVQAYFPTPTKDAISENPTSPNQSPGAQP